MKKIKYLFISLVIVLFTSINVKAYEPSLITVSDFNINNGVTESFDVYSYKSTQIYRKGNELYYYSNISNLNDAEKPISASILLFDKDQKNIGVFNYCSSKDFSSDFSFYKILPNQSVEFNYLLDNSYLVNKDKSSKYTVNDVMYYAMIDENEFCKIGGYSKYKGLTLNEIINEDQKEEVKDDEVDVFISKISSLIPGGLGIGLGIALAIIVISIVITIIIWVAYGKFLNALHERMLGKKTALAYIPIGNNFVCIRLAFGKIIGFAYLGVLLFSILLTFIGFGFISYIVSLLCFAAFILDVIKLITGKYDLCYLDNANNNVLVDNVNTNNNSNNNTNGYGYNQSNNVQETMMSSGDFDMNAQNNGNFNTNNNNNSNDQEETDLSRFFR